MDSTEFRKLYNQRIREMRSIDRAECLGVVAVDGDAVVMNTRTPKVNLRF